MTDIHNVRSITVTTDSGDTMVFTGSGKLKKHSTTLTDHQSKKTESVVYLDMSMLLHDNSPAS